MLALVPLLVLCVEDPPERAAGLAPPVRVESGGEPIDVGPEWGHAAPEVCDLDGDGRADLIVGSFGNHFHRHLAVGDASAGTPPTLVPAGLIQAGGVAAEVNIYCCIGAQARVCDLDGDGKPDLLANSYDPGHAYLFRGSGGELDALIAGVGGLLAGTGPRARSGGLTFAAREELLDVAGVPVRWEPDQQQDVESFGSFFTPVDWDADGDPDVLIGGFDGTLRWRENTGTPTAPAFAPTNTDVSLASGEPLKVQAHLCPAVADWDGDGRWDLVCGSDDGSVVWFRNAGADGTPSFEPARTLVPPAADGGYGRMDFGDAPPAPGIRSQPAVADWDGDGDLDLLVGDFSSALPFRTDLTAEERAAAEGFVAASHKAAEPLPALLEQLRADHAARFPGDEWKTDEASEAWSEAYRGYKNSPEMKRFEAAEAKAAAGLRPLLRGTPAGDSLFRLTEAHGFVWFYERTGPAGR